MYLVRDPIATSSARIVRVSLKTELDTSAKNSTTYDQRVWEAERSAGEGKMLIFSRIHFFKLSSTGEYALLNLLYVPEGSYLAALRDYLVRVEDLPHILVWTKGDGKGNAVNVDLIELPRLGVSFASRVDASGASRMYSSLHVGMYLSLKWTPAADKSFACFPHGLVLENVDGEMAVMVPATLPQKVKYATGGGRLVFCHAPPVGDSGIVGVVPHYYYPVHLSNMFLFTTTLEAALYLILMRAIHYLYAEALQLAEACITDSVTPEAAAIWDCMQTILVSTSADLMGQHTLPDAHAFRLRMHIVSLLAMHVDYQCKWNLEDELVAYAIKLGSINATCRLPPQQEEQLIQAIPPTSKKEAILNKVLETFSLRAKKETDITLPMRINYLASVLANRPALNVLYPERAPLQDQFDMVADKTCLTPHDDSFLSKFSKVSYKRPVEVSGAPAVGQLYKWLENGLRLGGGKDDLGFLFMYELMTGTLQFSAVSGDNPYFLGCLLLRLLPPKDYQDTSLTMSMLRVLARTPTLALDPSIPKVDLLI